MEHIIYSEENPVPTWTKLLFVLIIAVFPPIIFLQLLSGVFIPKLIILGFALDAFFIAIYFNFRKLVVKVSEDELTVSFGFIKKKIPIKDIIMAKTTSAKLGIYGGNGIRLGGDGSLAFITNFGDAVKLTRTSSRPFVFSTNNPDKLVDVISFLKTT